MITARENQGLVRGYLDDYDGALADFERCLAISPRCWPPYFNRARVRYRMQDWQGAIQDYTTVLSLAPDGVLTGWTWAELYCIFGPSAEALADYEVAIKTAENEHTRQML